MTSFRKDNFKLAVASLKAAKARSFLTMLGIIIGVMAVVCVVCIGQGVKQQISGEVSQHAKDVITVRPGVNTASLGAANVFSGGNTPAGTTTMLNDADLETVAKTDGVKLTVPLSIATGSVKGDREVVSPLVIATTSDFPDVLKQKFAYGDFFDASDNSRTVVLGKSAATALFDDPAPLGQTLTYRGQNFIVTGVYTPFPSAPFSSTANFNDAIFIPSAAAKELTNNTLGMYQILAQIKDSEDSERVARSIEANLQRAHGGSLDDTVQTANETNAASSQTIHLLTLFIIGVAGIALLVGGIGIMNVMLVSVTERMHEIGLRKAIGATNQQILRQFMAEALVLSTTGAVIGVILSSVAVGVIRAFTTLQPVLVWPVLGIAPLVAIAVGTIFGTAPAVKAARKDPIEALRHE